MCHEPVSITALIVGVAAFVLVAGACLWHIASNDK